MRKTCTNQYKILKIDTFSGAGGGTRFYGQNNFMDTWAFLKLENPSGITFYLNWEMSTEGAQENDNLKKNFKAPPPNKKKLN